MRRSTQLFIAIILASSFYTGCDDGDGGGGQGAPTPAPTGSPPPGGGVPPPGSGAPAPAPVPQTGQTTCWDSDGNIIDCAGTGQDGDIRAGVMPPDPRFTDNGDGTITDNLTRLVWLKDANCLDDTTTWQGALDFANGLNDGCLDCGGTDSDCGLTDGSMVGDWRLPNIRELATLIDYEKSVGPVLSSPNPFMNFQSLTFYWSSTTNVFLNNAFIVGFDSGAVAFDFKANPGFVLPVRGEASGEAPPAPVPQTGQMTCWDSLGNRTGCAGTGQDGDIQAGVMPLDPRFTDNMDGTITDNLTGLIWLEDANCPDGRRTWEAALADVAELNSSETMNENECVNYSGTFTDWRLPNIRELASLIDYEIGLDPVLPSPNPFMSFQSDPYWSSTTGAFDPPRAWFVVFDSGAVDFDVKANPNFVLPVRGGS